MFVALTLLSGVEHKETAAEVIHRLHDKIYTILKSKNMIVKHFEGFFILVCCLRNFVLCKTSVWQNYEPLKLCKY